MSNLFVPPFGRATSATGEVLSGAKLYVYLSGTTTPTDAYTTDDLSVAHANPVIADSGGLFPSIYLDPNVEHRVVLKTSADVTIDDVDPYRIGYGVLTATTTWDPLSVANGASTATLVTVTGAAIGDPVVVGFTSITAGNWQISGSVTATNQVTVSLLNHTGGAVDLASGTLRVAVFKF